MRQVTFDRDGLLTVGFAGFVAIRRLAELNGQKLLPQDPGVYVVLRDATSDPAFLAVGSGGWFKGTDPNVPMDVLRGRWVATSSVVYIGKATSLRSRIGQLVRFGQGKNVGHFGGRYLWQLADSVDLVVAWQGHAGPAARESELLAQFAEAHGSLPFANLRW